MNTLVFNLKPINYIVVFIFLGYVTMQARFTFETNKRNTLNICDQNGFQYCRDSKFTNRWGEDRWTCCNRTQGCKVVVKTKGDFIIAQKNVHTCS